MADERTKPVQIDIDTTENFEDATTFPEGADEEAEFREVSDQTKGITEKYLSQFWERCKDIPEANEYSDLKTKAKTICGALNELYDMIKAK